MKLKPKQLTIAILILLIIGLAVFILFISSRLSTNNQSPIPTKAGTLSGKDGPGDCGQSCSSNLDCKAAANGGTSTCSGGTCQNAICLGKTIPGANCDCAIQNPCGQGCSAAAGLCQVGTTCRYIDGPNCDNNPDTNHPTNTLCVPDNYPSLVKNNCVARDTYNFYVTVNGASPTQSQLLQFCSPTITCYKCSNQTTNSCSPTTINAASCPSGTSNDPNGCASAAGGSCISVSSVRSVSSVSSISSISSISSVSSVSSISSQILCYRCASAQTSAVQCESFNFNGSNCPSGASSDPNGCAAAVGGSCPIVYTPPKPLPNTSIISDRSDPILFGIFNILLGILIFKYNLINKLMHINPEIIFIKYSDVKRKNLQRRIKKDRVDFEKKIEDKVEDLD